jgi:GntR family carbon starvation induced transcriptional regulator
MNSDSNASSAAQILGRMRQDLLEGHFRPGEKLTMHRLKTRYGVGVSPLREALSQLLSERLVTAENQKGFRASPISRPELIDLYQTRARIEALCIELAIERGEDHWEAAVVAAAHRLRKARAPQGEPAGAFDIWEAQHQDFHTALVSACDSTELLRIRRDLHARATRYQNLWLRQNPGGTAAFDASQREHQLLEQAALGRNRQAAQALVYDHLLAPVEALQGMSARWAMD